MRNETGQLRWNPDRAGGCFIVDTPGVKVYIGRTPKESVEYGGLTLTLEQSRLRWGAVSITAAEPPSGGSGDVLAPGRYLIAATGDVRNTGATYVSPEPDQITTAADYGGADGEAPILCEGLAAVIHLSKISRACHALPAGRVGEPNRGNPCRRGRRRLLGTARCASQNHLVRAGHSVKRILRSFF